MTLVSYDFSLLLRPEDLSVGIPEDSPEWPLARRGRITASSRAHKLITGREKTLSIMMNQMAQDLKDPVKDGGFSSAAIDHGNAFEDQAISEYEMMRLTSGEIVRKPGLFVHPDFDIASATPDFFEGDSITGQVKCPYKLKNHLNLLHFGCRMVKPEYYTQVQFEAFVTGREEIIFISYHPEAPAQNQVFIEEVPLDDEYMEKFHQKLTAINHMLVNDERPGLEEKDPFEIPEIF